MCSVAYVRKGRAAQECCRFFSLGLVSQAQGGGNVSCKLYFVFLAAPLHHHLKQWQREHLPPAGFT